MIVTFIVLALFVNIVRWAELADNTNVRSFKDLRKFNNGIFYSYNFVLLLIFVIMFILTKEFKII